MKSIHSFRCIGFMLFGLATLLAARPAPAQSGDNEAQLTREFEHPPATARARTWWHWMDGYVSKEGIKADLEAMKKAGLGGAYMFTVDYNHLGGQSAREKSFGDAPPLSPQWWDLVKYAMAEADRLGLELGAHNCGGWSSSGGPWITPERSMQKIVWSTTTAHGGQHVDLKLDRPVVDPKWNYYEDIAVQAVPERDEAVALDKVLDLTKRMTADGSLSWDAPAGEWRVIRFGHTTTGRANRPSPPELLGLECDKFDPAAVKINFDHYLGQMLKNAGPGAPRELSIALIDSYEVGAQNWSGNFREEFRNRRGYDMLKWLPTMAAPDATTIESQDRTKRFKSDMKQTIAELFAEKYYGTMLKLAHDAGMRLGVEPYTGPFDTLTVCGQADVLMGEFWKPPRKWGYETLKRVASGAHTYGVQTVGAEAFTGAPTDAHWNVTPRDLKTCGDLAFTRGINQMVLHTSAHQPWLGVAPGMSMQWWGTHFGRTQTWWEPGKTWFDYLARCQYLLQSGRFVGDVLAFGTDAQQEGGFDADAISEELLLKKLTVQDGELALPDGMRYRVLAMAEATSPTLTMMTPQVARKIKELVAAGAVLIGSKPQVSPSLQDYPKCDAEVQGIGEEVWGDADGKGVTEHSYGKGKVFWGVKPEDVLAKLGVEPDVTLQGGDENSPLIWIHRRNEFGDFYFVANQSAEPVDASATFRVKGPAPQFWDPMTGKRVPAAEWKSDGAHTRVRLRLNAEGSVFVVFPRNESAHPDPVTELAREGAAPANDTARVEEAKDGKLMLRGGDGGKYRVTRAAKGTVDIELPEAPAPLPVSGPWKVSFPPKLGAPESVTLSALGSLSEQADAGVKYFSGTATYRTSFDVAAEMKASGNRLWLDLGDVASLAGVTLNGKELGDMWMPPFRFDVTDVLKAGKNKLEVRVTNAWQNRMIGDDQLPDDVEWGENVPFQKNGPYVGRQMLSVPEWLKKGEKRPTARVTFASWDYFTKDSPLLPSGLLGPVKVITETSAAIGN